MFNTGLSISALLARVSLKATVAHYADAKQCWAAVGVQLNRRLAKEGV